MEAIRVRNQNMNQCVQNIVIISLVLLVEPAVGGDGPRSSDAVRQSLAKYHADAKPNEATLRVVCFIRPS